MKNSLLLCSIVLLSGILFSSCGVMFGGSKYRGAIYVKDHPDAEIYVDGKKIGEGKAQELFPRNRPLTVELKEEGCPTKTLTFNKSFRTGNFILSTLTWGLIGIGVDLGTGAAYKPDHKNDPAIEKITDKEYVFNLEYPECSKL